MAAAASDTGTVSGSLSESLGRHSDLKQMLNQPVLPASARVARTSGLRERYRRASIMRWAGREAAVRALVEQLKLEDNGRLMGLQPHLASAASICFCSNAPSFETSPNYCLPAIVQLSTLVQSRRRRPQATKVDLKN